MSNLENATYPEALICYHANCIDGFTSAWVAAKAMEQDNLSYSLMEMNYDEKSYDELIVFLESVYARELKQVYIVDFSLPVNVLEKCTETANLDDDMFVILDHHKTAFERYCPEGYEVEKRSSEFIEAHGATIILDNARSGASLAYKFFNITEHKPYLISRVEDYDLWKFIYNDTKPLNRYLRGEPKTVANWSRIAADCELVERQTEILARGDMLLAEHRELVCEIAARAVPVKLLGYEGLGVECKDYDCVSDVGNMLAKHCGTFGLMRHTKQDGTITCSIRSIGGFDVSVIAKHFGGGGHLNAAGFSLIKGEFRAEDISW